MNGIPIVRTKPQAITAAVVRSGGVERQIVFSTRNGFPEVGKTDTLYIAVDENKCYIFDGTQNEYKPVGGSVGIDDVDNEIASALTGYYTKAQTDSLLADFVRRTDKLIINCALS